MPRLRSVTRLGLERLLLGQFARLQPGVVLDVGSKVSPYKASIPHTRYVRLDISPKSNPDLCCDIQDIRAEANSFDTVIATEVLEHVLDPQKAVEEIRRVLKPGGVCILTTRFFYRYHPDPHDYWRFTWDSLSHLFREYSTTEVLHHGNRLHTLCTAFDHGSTKLLARLVSPLVARVHVAKTRFPLGYVVYAIK